MGKKTGETSFTAHVIGHSTLKPLGNNEGSGCRVKITLELPAKAVDLNRMADFQASAEDLLVTLVPAQGELPGTGD